MPRGSKIGLGAPDSKVSPFANHVRLLAEVESWVSMWHVGEEQKKKRELVSQESVSYMLENWRKFYTWSFDVWLDTNPNLESTLGLLAPSFTNQFRRAQVRLRTGGRLDERRSGRISARKCAPRRMISFNVVKIWCGNGCIFFAATLLADGSMPLSHTSVGASKSSAKSISIQIEKYKDWNNWWCHVERQELTGFVGWFQQANVKMLHGTRFGRIQIVKMGQVRKVYLAKIHKAEAKCQVLIWFENSCPRANRCSDKSRSECNHHYRLASHDVLKSTMPSWTWSSASTQKGAKCVDEFKTQLMEELREEKNVRITLERDICELKTPLLAL